MHLIQRTLAEYSGLPASKQITLAAERRQFLKRRWRGIAEDGTEFGFDLESRLTDGCVIFQQAGCDYIVRQLPETVYEIPFFARAHAAAVGGNSGELFALDADLDAYIYLIDVAEGDKIPRKGGPAIRTSDLLLINKTDLAPYVGADLDVMARDAKIQRGMRPFLFADLKSEKGKDDLLAWLRREYLFL